MCWQCAVPSSNLHPLPSTEIEGINCQPPAKPMDDFKDFFSFSQMLAKHYVSSIYFLLELIQWQQSSHYFQQEGFIGGGQWGLASALVVKADSLANYGCICAKFLRFSYMHNTILSPCLLGQLLGTEAVETVLLLVVNLGKKVRFHLSSASRCFDCTEELLRC